MKTREIWLEGPVESVPALLQPVAHALLQVRAEVRDAVANLSPAELRARPGGAASIAFHLLHMTGALDRLFTYARGEALTPEQRDDLALERAGGDPDAGAAALVSGLEARIEVCLAQLRATRPESLVEERKVGAAGRPSTVLGLLFHGAEHTQRHLGQVVTTSKLLGSEAGSRR